jgi:hypothetical protein
MNLNYYLFNDNQFYQQLRLLKIEGGIFKVTLPISISPTTVNVANWIVQCTHSDKHTFYKE